VRGSVRFIILICVAGFVLVMSGCGGGPLELEQYCSQIKVGQSNSTDVLNMLPEKGMMHTTGSVSVVNHVGGSRELAIVVFSQDDSLVQRTDYLQKRESLSQVKLHLEIQTIVPDKLLEEPYENDMRKHVAILRHCHTMLKDDARPFNEDQETESLAGLARTALSVGIHQLTIRPREAYLLLQPQGFDFKHPMLDKCRLFLKQVDNSNVFVVTVRSKTMRDPLVAW